MFKAVTKIVTIFFLLICCVFSAYIGVYALNEPKININVDVGVEDDVTPEISAEIALANSDSPLDTLEIFKNKANENGNVEYDYVQSVKGKFF